KLRTDGSLTADVLVRDQPANVGTLEKIAANQTMAVPISSVLKVNGNLAGGAFRGSAVINVDIL
ncbi:adhesin, partial [Serratia fonticola]